MRPLEWLLLLSFVPVLLIPFIPQRWRRYGVIIAVSLPIMVSLLQILVEGWRVQIVPLYGLAVLVLVSRVLGRKAAVRRGRGALVSGIVGLGVIGTGVLAGWLLPVLHLPEPTGPYQVGIVDRELAGERRLMASVWYPSEQDGARAPLFADPDITINGLADSFGLPALALQHLRYFTTAASEGVPILASDAALPVLVFSHGLVGSRMQNSTTLQELASWGYVVVALDHTDAAAVTVFPDGEVRPFDMGRFGITYVDDEQYAAAVNDQLFPVWVDDQRRVYDTLETWADSDPLLAGRLDLTQIASLGHSFGGATSLEVCRVEPRCRAAVNLDGGLYGDIVTEPAVRPLLLMTSAESTQYAEAMAKWTAMIAAAATGDAYWLELTGSTHFSFTITPLLSPILAPPGFNPYAGLGVVDQYLRAFFETHMRGAASELLEPNPNATDVRWMS